MSAFCEHGDYGQACAQCHYEAHDGKCCCDSCHLIRCRKRIATLEQQNAELAAALGMLIDLHDAAGMPAGPIRNNAQKTIAKVKQP